MKRDAVKWRWLAAVALAGSSLMVMSAVTKMFPGHWGDPPKVETRDYVRLPGGFGHGSSTLAQWIAANLARDQAAAAPAAPATPAVKPLYQNDFEQATIGEVPEDFLVLNGVFAVRAEGGNQFLEAPGAPVDDYAVLFGPTEKEGLAITARVFATRHGRRLPVMAIGLNGLGGYELQLAPAKKALELFKGEERVQSVACTWESGSWTMMRLQVRKAGESQWKIEGKVWKQGAPEPAGWMLTYDETTEPPPGRPLISGHPFSGTPIRFDDLVVTLAR